MHAKFISAILFASVASICTTANANGITFHYNTSELASPAGLNAVYSRIQYRANAACSTNDPRALWRRSYEAKCEAELINDIVSKIDHAGLSAVHARAAGADRFATRNK